jgi:hypothetical protein
MRGHMRNDNTDIQSTKGVNRIELYELVWTEPMRDVARRFGISDVGLAKLCRRVDIPTPKAGYWMKARHGKAVRRLPLSINRNHDESIILTPRVRTVVVHPPVPDDIEEAIRRVSEDNVRIPKASSSHKIIDRWKSVDKRDTLSYEPYRTIGPRTSHIERRRRNFLSFLFRQIERHGGNVTEIDRFKFNATIAGEVVEFAVRERLKQERVPITPEERRSRMYGDRDSRVETVSTGTLKLQVGSYYTASSKKRFCDLPDQPLEVQWKNIQIVLLNEAADVRRIRLSREADERLRVQREVDWLAAEEKRRAENERLEALLSDIENWRRAQDIREFVDAIRATTLQCSNPPPALEEWVTWARTAANAMDPLCKDRRHVSQSSSEDTASSNHRD